MNDRDFSIGGRDFKLSKIDAVKQFHIVRRMTPMLTELLPALGALQKGTKKLDEMTEQEKLANIEQFAAPIMKGLSALNDKDADHVLYGLLSSVEVKQATGNWAKIASGEMLMMQDFELPVLLQVAGRAFMFNLSGFFGALPRPS